MIQGGTSTQAKSRQGRKIKMGMIGGSLEAFIGAVHRRGAQLDGEIELVCGAFSSSAQKSKETGEALYLDPARVYASYEDMILKEKELPEGERMDFVTIVTPNVFSAGQAVIFKTSTVTNIVAGTIYYVITTGLTTSGFQVSATVGGVAITPTGGTGGTFIIESESTDSEDGSEES